MVYICVRSKKGVRIIEIEAAYQINTFDVLTVLDRALTIGRFNLIFIILSSKYFPINRTQKAESKVSSKCQCGQCKSNHKQEDTETTSLDRGMKISCPDQLFYSTHSR